MKFVNGKVQGFNDQGIIFTVHGTTVGLLPTNRAYFFNTKLPKTNLTSAP